MVKTSVLLALGGWDTVNRGADAEFRDRLAISYGGPIPVVGETPLSFTRTREGSLTSGEMSRGYIDSSRLLYLAAYQRWHRSDDGDNSLVLGADSGRPFPSHNRCFPACGASTWDDSTSCLQLTSGSREARHR